MSITNMPDQRLKCLIGDPAETDMPHWRLTYLFGDPYETDMPHRIPIFLIGDLSETDMLDQRCPIGTPIRHVGLKSIMLVFDQSCRSPFNHVGLWSGMSLSDGSLISHVRLRWVSDQAWWFPIRHVGLQWVSDRSPIIIICTWNLYYIVISFKKKYFIFFLNPRIFITSIFKISSILKLFILFFLLIQNVLTVYPLNDMLTPWTKTRPHYRMNERLKRDRYNFKVCDVRITINHRCTK